MRQLATIREIKELRAIEGADRIECAIVDGWECVVAKEANLKIGDKVIYIEIDSILPEREEFEFMRNRKFRVRTIKLKKQISQGLILPLSILPNKKYQVSDDVTDILGIIKYDPQAEQELKETKQKQIKSPIIKFLLRYGWFRRIFSKPKRKDGFPDWIVKTDEDRIQNRVIMFDIERRLKTKFVSCEKLDGQSLTLFVKRLGKNKFDFGVCSRNLRLKTPDSSSWWTIAKQINANDVLMELLGDNDVIVLQGEIIGEGIQGNKYKIKGLDFYAFNLIINGVKTSTINMKLILDKYNIKTVPIIEELELKDTIADMVEYAKGKSVLIDTKREGVVLRNYDRSISFKIINPDFLLAEKD